MSTTTDKGTMQAVFQLDPKSRNLELKEFPQPTSSKDGHHLVAVRATAVCRGELDWEVQDPRIFATSKRDRIPGVEGSGIIASAPAHSPFKCGDSVFFATDSWDTVSACAFSLVRGAQLAPKPESLDWAQAAATPLSALSAWHGVFEHGSPRRSFHACLQHSAC